MQFVGLREKKEVGLSGGKKSFSKNNFIQKFKSVALRSEKQNFDKNKFHFGLDFEFFRKNSGKAHNIF